MADDIELPPVPTAGLPPADPTIGLNAVVSNIRRARAMPQRAPEAPPLPDLPKPAATQPSEFDRLFGQALKLFEKHPEDERQAKLDELTKMYEELGIKRAQAEAAAPTTTSAPTVEGTTPEMEAYLKQNEIDEGGAGNTQIDNLEGSGAHGLFQFMPATWADVTGRHPELNLTKENLYEKDAAKARQYQTSAMKAFTQDNVAHFEKEMGRKPTGGEMYLMHMLGPGGGVRLARDAAKPLTETVDGGALRGNRGLAKFKTGAEALNYYNRRYS